MLQNKFIFFSNISSNLISVEAQNSSVPNTLFELMKTNVLIVNGVTEEEPNPNNRVLNPPREKVSR